MATFFRNIQPLPASGRGIPTDLELENAKIIISVRSFPQMAANIASFYKSLSPPSGKIVAGRNKFTWAQIDQKFTDSRRGQIVIKVTNPTDRLSIDMEWIAFTPEVESSISIEIPNLLVQYYIFEKKYSDKVHILGGNASLGLVSIMGLENNIPKLYLFRDDLAFPTGAGGPPYAGVKIPNS